MGKTRYQLRQGDCLEVMRKLKSGVVDAVVTDPPYGLKFMGQAWDYNVPDVEVWREVLRVLKPGGYLLSFFGTRTYHRGVVNVEDAGFEIRDQLGWMYGNGFPKSLDVSKAIDKAAGAKREVVGVNPSSRPNSKKAGLTGFDNREGSDEASSAGTQHITAPATEEAAEWDGFGTCLKPAWEPIVMARKPLEGTVAENTLEHGTGGLNIDECRVGLEGSQFEPGYQTHATEKQRIYGNGNGIPPMMRSVYNANGRYPANVIHDGSDEVLAVLSNHARFFYCAKASRKERDSKAKHPTVKPVALMRWLVKLVTRRGGLVLDPYMGSGSTGVACVNEGRRFIGIELDEKYFAIAERRISKAVFKGGFFDL